METPDLPEISEENHRRGERAALQLIGAILNVDDEGAASVIHAHMDNGTPLISGLITYALALTMQLAINDGQTALEWFQQYAADLAGSGWLDA